MELEHQHERRLPESDPDSDGFANGHPGYPNSNSDGNANADTGDTNAYCDTKRVTDLRTELVVWS